ncbi:hypothetical protein F971_02676 [Acinetobacter vivianii]|uniref:Uncharacterized protein n=2 Tax=Acinetobacter vivianii TaxID=1776742 RepID=N8W9K6_9GAMM|nr:hypothetical protein F971_02676 [Acinetobacter vivianii]
MHNSGNKKALTKLAGIKGLLVANIGILTMNSMVQIGSKNQVYDASDVAEGFTLAYEQVADIAAMLDAIQHKQERTIEYLAKVYNVPEFVFKELTRLFQITESMIQDSMTFSKEQEDSYKSLNEGKAS